MDLIKFVFLEEVELELQWVIGPILRVLLTHMCEQNLKVCTASTHCSSSQNLLCIRFGRVKFSILDHFDHIRKKNYLDIRKDGIVVNFGRLTMQYYKYIQSWVDSSMIEKFSKKTAVYHKK